MKPIPIFCVLSLMLLCTNVHPIFAKVPTTPKILFTSAPANTYEVYVMNPDGSEQMNLTQHPANDLNAVWSPTGEQILFVSDRGGPRDLYVMDPDGTNVRRVFKFKIEDWRTHPNWSPDGKRIAYVQVNLGKLTDTLYIATLGEKKEEKLAIDGYYPAWSPDGTEIACSVGERLTLINVHTRKQEHLLRKKTIFWQRSPSWSAIGDKLAFSGNNHPLPVLLDKDLHNAWKNKQVVYIVNRDGTGLQQLVDEGGPYAQYPELSPNGDEVLYTQEINGQFQIFKIEVNSKIQTQLTHIGWNFGGDWFDPAYALPVSPQSQLLTTTWSKVKK